MCRCPSDSQEAPCLFLGLQISGNVLNHLSFTLRLSMRVIIGASCILRKTERNSAWLLCNVIMLDITETSRISDLHLASTLSRLPQAAPDSDEGASHISHCESAQAKAWSIQPLYLRSAQQPAEFSEPKLLT